MIGAGKHEDLGNTAQFAKQELSSLYSGKMPMDNLRITCEGAVMIAGEKESPIRNVSIKDSAFRWKRQGSLIPDCLDEQPSKRGVYRRKVPVAYIRCSEKISIEDHVCYEIDDSMKDYISGTIDYA